MSNESAAADCGLAALRRQVWVDGVELSLLEWAGAGVPVILWHGVTSSAASYWQLAGDLARAGRRVMAFDLPGHGSSGLSPRHAIPELADLLLRACAAAGIERFELIGHSWGGALAVCAAAQAGPSVVVRLVLIDPLLGLEAATAPQWMDGFAEGLGRPAAELLVTLREKWPDWAACDHYWKAVALEQCRHEQVHGLFHPTADWQLVDDLLGLTMPTLVLLADPTRTIVWPDAARQLNRRMMQSTSLQVATVTGASHSIQRGPSYGALWRELVDFELVDG